MEGALPKAQVVDNIRQVASNILPHGSKLYLYGQSPLLFYVPCRQRIAY